MSNQSGYDSSLSYRPGQMVIGSDGNVYQSIVRVPIATPPPNDDFWEIVPVTPTGGATGLNAAVELDVPDQTAAYGLVSSVPFGINLSGQDPGAFEEAQASVTMPPQTVAEGGVLISLPSVTAQVEFAEPGLNSPVVVFDFQMRIVIANAAGTEILLINGDKQTEPDSEGVTELALTGSGLTPVAVAGSDLVYDTETGTVTSTAGGVYTLAVSLVAGWGE